MLGKTQLENRTSRTGTDWVFSRFRVSPNEGRTLRQIESTSPTYEGTLMKGIVFTEFQEMVEKKFGLEVLDKIIETSDLPSGGVWTAVGTYDHQELIQLVTSLSRETKTPVPLLANAFGHHFFDSLVQAFGTLLHGIDSAIDLFAKVESYIHVEVRKLYPQAELPRFEFRQLGDNQWEVRYFSTRPFADLAQGLMEATANHFNEELHIEHEDLDVAIGSAARFVITSPLRVNAPCRT